MQFLVDAQLPPALARWLSERGHTAEHVADIGLTAAKDRDIWTYASSASIVIITKDEDFSNRRTLASSGPAIVWIRRGNCTKRELLTWFEPLLPVVLEALQRGEQLIEVT